MLSKFQLIKDSEEKSKKRKLDRSFRNFRWCFWTIRTSMKGNEFNVWITWQETKAETRKNKGHQPEKTPRKLTKSDRKKWETVAHRNHNRWQFQITLIEWLNFPRHRAIWTHSDANFISFVCTSKWTILLYFAKKKNNRRQLLHKFILTPFCFGLFVV